MSVSSYVRAGLVGGALVLAAASNANANGYERCLQEGGVPFTGPGQDFTHRQGRPVVIDGVPTQLVCIRGNNFGPLNAAKRAWLQQRLGRTPRFNRHNAIPYER